MHRRRLAFHYRAFLFPMAVGLALCCFPSKTMAQAMVRPWNLPPTKYPKPPPPAKSLELRLSSSKASYKLGEPVRLEVKFVNRTSQRYSLLLGLPRGLSDPPCYLKVSLKEGRLFAVLPPANGIPPGPPVVLPLPRDSAWSYGIAFHARYRFLLATTYTVQAVYEPPTADEYRRADVWEGERLKTRLVSNTGLQGHEVS